MPKELLEMGILLAQKMLNSYNNKEIAAFISDEFDCTVSEKEVAAFRASQLPEAFDLESRKIQYYGSNVCNSRYNRDT